MIVRSGSGVDAALKRIEAEDGTLRAWAYAATAAGETPPVEGPLAGLPFGVKDVIDVARMPTAFGLWPEHRKARLDAWIVALLRATGAIPVGKTHTTAYAYRDPAPTLNPLDERRTPGGSSAGSAAAVAAGHVPFALGTQTTGSVLRPAAFCGVVGYKPTYGWIPTAGVGVLAPSLDTVGIIAADTAIVRRVARTLFPGLADAVPASLRLGLASSVYDGKSAARTHAAVRGAVARLGAAGAIIETVALPEAVDCHADVDTIVAYEAYAALAPLLAHALPPQLAGLLDRGRQTDRGAYVAALERREQQRPAIDEVLAAYDAIIVPCGDAAPSPETTGDTTPFTPWSYFGVPAVSVPIPGTAPAAVSLQLVATRHADARLLGVAARVESALTQ